MRKTSKKAFKKELGAIVAKLRANDELENRKKKGGKLSIKQQQRLCTPTDHGKVTTALVDTLTDDQKYAIYHLLSWDVSCNGLKETVKEV